MADDAQTNEHEDQQAEPGKTYPMKEFLEGTPPEMIVDVHDMAFKTGNHSSDNKLLLPEIMLHCDNSACNGLRLFETNDSEHITPNSARKIFIDYTCKNCGESVKQFALWFKLSNDRVSGKVYKFGEFPHFGPPTPSRVISVLGPERDYYLKGRKSENMGLGIAAFAYYRRVVDNQKNRIFDEIIRTVKKVDPTNTSLIAELEAAKAETQFTKAVESIKHGIPQALLIDGHNPLTLLHSALSEGLHAGTDEECLEFATSIRVILFELVERMSNAMKNSVELKMAMSKILQKKAPLKQN